MPDGHLVERIVGEFSSSFFMKDFVILNPKYNRAGYEKELADLLLVLADDCMVISVKATDQKPKPKTKLKRWLTKKTLEGMKQAKGGIAWLSKVSCAGKNLWEEIREFQANSLRPVCGIVLLECSQEPYEPIKFPIPKFESEVPIHFLSLNDFLNMVTLLGSIWDVFHFFSSRADVREVFTGINQEREVFGHYWLLSPDLTRMQAMSNSELEKLRARANLHLFYNIHNYQERDRLADHVNVIVHALHFPNPNADVCTQGEFQPSWGPFNEQTAYLKVAAKLNALPMSNKARIGQKIEGLLEDVRHSGKAGNFVFRRLQSDLVIVFACFSGSSRSERARLIGAMLPAALYRYGGAEGLGVALDADDTESGFDLVWGRDPQEFTEEDRRLAKLLFPGPVECYVADPFGNSREYTPE